MPKYVAGLESLATEYTTNRFGNQLKFTGVVQFQEVIPLFTTYCAHYQIQTEMFVSITLGSRIRKSLTT